MTFSPQQLLDMADYLETAAKGMRYAANILRRMEVPNGAEFSLPQPPEMKPIPAPATSTPIPPFNGVPTVSEAISAVLSSISEPIYIADLFTEITKLGAQVKSIAILSSMLSKDKGVHFRPAPGKRGHWELTPAEREKLNSARIGL